VLDAAQVRAQLGQVGLGRHALARRQQRELALVLVALQVVQALDAQADGLEVRQQAAEPAVVDVRHARGLGGVLHRVAGLLLRAHEEHGAAAMGQRRRELLRLLDEGLRAQQVDDVDAPALAVDETAHLGVPAAGLVAEVDPGLQELPEVDCHVLLPWFVCVWNCSRTLSADPESDGARPGRARSGAVQGR
jgi:hypothetical protein